MSNSRETILGRIRSALASDPEVPMPPTPQVWPTTEADGAALAARFIEELEAVHGEVVAAASMEEAAGRLAELADEGGWQRVAAVDSPEMREVAAALPPERVAWAAEERDAPAMADLAAGIVPAARLLADTGSCLVECRTGVERLLCYLPPACVVLAGRAQLAEHLPAAWGEVVRGAAETGRRGEYVIVTGPSRTADIEKILILGVHGPKRLIVLLVG